MRDVCRFELITVSLHPDFPCGKRKKHKIMCRSKRKSRANPCRFFKKSAKAVQYTYLEKYGSLHDYTDRTWANFPTSPAGTEQGADRTGSGPKAASDWTGRLCMYKFLCRVEKTRKNSKAKMRRSSGKRPLFLVEYLHERMRRVQNIRYA